MMASIELFLWIKFLLLAFTLYTSVIASLNFCNSFSGLYSRDSSLQNILKIKFPSQQNFTDITSNLNVQQIVPLHSCAVTYHVTGVHAVTITLRCVLVWICTIFISRTKFCFCEWNMRHSLVAHWLYIARRKKKNDIWLTVTHGTRFLSIWFKLTFEVLYTTNSEWYWFVHWNKILHSVKDQHSIQLGFASLIRTSICHLMQNLVTFTICIPSLNFVLPDWASTPSCTWWTPRPWASSSSTASWTRSPATGPTASSPTSSARSTAPPTRTSASTSCSTATWTPCGWRTWTRWWTTTGCWRWPTGRGSGCRNTVLSSLRSVV